MTTHLTSALALTALAGFAATVEAQPVSTDLGRLADANTVVFASASVTSPQFPFNFAVFDRQGQVVGQARSIATGSFTLPLQLSKGTFYLAAWGGFGVASSPWQVSTVGVGSGNDAQFVGSRFTSDLGDLDSATRFYRFYVGEPSITNPSGDVVTTRASFDIETSNDDFDTVLGLYSDTGSLLGGDNAIAGTTRFRFANRPAGYYILAVSGERARFGGNFLADPEEDSQSGWTTLSFGDEEVENLFVGTNQVVWSDFRVRDEGPDIQIPVDIPEVQLVQVSMRGLDPLDPSVALFDDGGTLITVDIDASVASLSRSLQAGEYVIAASSWLTNYGDDFFTLAKFGDGPGRTGPYELTVGPATIAGQDIESGGDTDFYRFTVEATVDLGEIAEGPQAFAFETSSSDPALDTEMALYNADGLLLQEDDNGGVGGLSRLGFPNGFVSGNYYVAVAGSDTIFRDGFETDVDGDEATGNYALEYTGLSQQTDLGFGGDVDFYTFEIGVPSDLGVLGNSGEVVSIDTFASQFDTVIAVWDESGALLEVNDDDMPTGESRIQRVYAPGIYHFGVTGSGANFDNGFRIDVSPAGPLGDYAGVAGDLPYSGSTAIRDRFDLFRFEITSDCSSADLAKPFDALDIFDVLEYLRLLDAGNPAADLDNSGDLDRLDVLIYLTVFDTGCQ